MATVIEGLHPCKGTWSGQGWGSECSPWDLGQREMMGGVHGQCKERLSRTLFNMHENTHLGALDTQLITCHQRKLTRPHELQRPAFHCQFPGSWPRQGPHGTFQTDILIGRAWGLILDPLCVFSQCLVKPVMQKSVPSLTLDLLPASGWIFSALDHPLGLQCQDSKHCRTNQPKVLHLKTTHSQKYELRTIAIPT